MDSGLAHQMTYGSGEDQNTKAYYAGTLVKTTKGKKMACKKKKRVKKLTK